MKIRRKRVLFLFVTLAMASLVGWTLPAIAAPAAVAADLDPVPAGTSAAGQLATFRFTISTSSRTLGSFTLSAPSAAYEVKTISSVVPAGGTVTVSGNAVVATGFSQPPPSTTTVTFTARTPCVAETSAWPLVAKDPQLRTFSSTGSDLTTEVAGKCHLGFVTQPNNAFADDLITSVDRDPTGDEVEVELLNGANERVIHTAVTVSFDLGSDPSGGAAGLTVVAESTGTTGVATFDEGLSIGTPNLAEASAYSLVPTSPSHPSVEGSASTGFDVWRAGTICSGGSDCTVTVMGDDDTYTVREDGVETGSILSVTRFGALASGVACQGYTELTTFGDWHEYTGGGGETPVYVVSHVTRQEMKLKANNGQSQVELCVALSEPWNDLLGTANDQSDGVDLDGDSQPDIWLGLAPVCPNQSSELFAPCVTRKYGDGTGGNITEAWLPGGDPGKRS